MATDDLKWLREEHRCGVIRIARCHIFDSEVRAFLGQCVIFKADQSFGWESIDYYCFHPDMEKSREGEWYNSYNLIKDPSGQLQLEKRAVELVMLKEDSLLRVQDIIDYSRNSR